MAMNIIAVYVILRMQYVSCGDAICTFDITKWLMRLIRSMSYGDIEPKLLLAYIQLTVPMEQEFE